MSISLYPSIIQCILQGLTHVNIIIPRYYQYHYPMYITGSYPCQYHYTQVSLSNVYYRVLPIYCGTSFKQLIAALKKASPTKRVEIIVSILMLIP